MFAGNSEYTDLLKVIDYLKKRKFAVYTDIKKIPDTNKVFISIPSSLVESRVEKGKTSQRQLLYLKKQIKSYFGYDVEFVIFIDQDFQKIEDGLNVLIKNKYPKLLMDTIVSYINPRIADVWINNELTDQIDVHLYKNINQDVVNYLKMYGMEVRNFNMNMPEKYLPSYVLILKCIKQLSPVTIAGLYHILNNKNCYMPSIEWLTSKLDFLRKKGYAIWQDNSTYVITSQGLSALPTPKSSSSSDVERVLELGRRRW